MLLRVLGTGFFFFWDFVEWWFLVLGFGVPAACVGSEVVGRVQVIKVERFWTRRSLWYLQGWKVQGLRARTCGVRDSRGGEFRSFLKQPAPVIFADLSLLLLCSISIAWLLGVSVCFRSARWSLVALRFYSTYPRVSLHHHSSLSLSLSPDFDTAFQVPETTSQNCKKTGRFLGFLVSFQCRGIR